MGASRSGDANRPTIDVCICTFRRKSVSETIASVVKQTYGVENIRIIVADNDVTNGAQDSIERIGESLGVRVHYVHAPHENISIARNACVNAVTAERFAFLDDDEWADPSWLQSLVDVMDRDGADVVFGPVDAVYEASVPAWWSHSGLHNNRPTILKGGLIVTGYTCNVLIRSESLQGLRFRLDFGKSGGEDTLFFNDLYRQGGRFAYAPEALVTEGVPIKRMRLRWLMARSFLGGQLHLTLCVMNKRPLTLVAFLSIFKSLYSLVFAALNIADPVKWRRNLMRASLHAGVIARRFGYMEIRRKNN